jgi:hypothetical protein
MNAKQRRKSKRQRKYIMINGIIRQLPKGVKLLNYSYIKGFMSEFHPDGCPNVIMYEE